MKQILTLMALTALGSTLVGCASASRSMGLTKTTPNEFNIITKAPLIVPPEYNLRPPRIGESSEENNYTQNAAREALIGDIDEAEPTQGELVLLAKVGVGRSDEEIRLAIDGQNSVERKTRGFSDRVLFWHDGKIINPGSAPLDPEVEARRLEAIKAATGGDEVTITRKPGTPKLPGL